MPQIFDSGNTTKSSFKIYNQRQFFRLKTEYVIICHIRDLWKRDTFVLPSAKIGNYHYTYDIWQEYFLKEISQKLLPFHFFAELLNKDYVIYNGLNFSQQSWYLRELSENGIIPYAARDAVLIVIGEDFSVNPFVDRLSDHLCDKILSWLTRDYNVQYNRILKLDEILIKDWKNALKVSKLNYDITEQTYFDINLLQLNLRNFNKN